MATRHCYRRSESPEIMALEVPCDVTHNGTMFAYLLILPATPRPMVG